MIKKAFKIKIPKEILDDIGLIDVVAKDLKMKIYVVGGLPRDIISGKPLTADTDLDITESLGNGFDLAFFVAAKYDLPEPKIYENTGTAMVVMPSGRMVEFHNAYHNVPHIIDQLYKMSISPSPLNKDIYSRDFTINTLLYDLDTSEMLDITEKGISDIKNRILRTPLSADKTLAINPKIILRGIRFKLEMGLSEDPEYSKKVPYFVPWLIDFLKNNKDSKMVSKTVRKTYEASPSEALREYRKLGILEYLPSSELLDNAIKEDMFGTTITPTSIEGDDVVIKEMQYSDKRVIVSQTTMIRHLMEEIDKHKAYINRKKREGKDRAKKKLDILEKARSGWYLENKEDPNVMRKKKKKYMGIPGREFIPKKGR